MEMLYWMHNCIIEGNIKEVPGIGDAEAKMLAADDGKTESITNTHQLIGKYFMLWGPEDNKTFSETNKKFCCFLKAKGIPFSHRTVIVVAISDTVSSFIPGLHDSVEFDEEYDNLSTTAVPHHVSSASDATETGAAGAAAVKVSRLLDLAALQGRHFQCDRTVGLNSVFGCCSDFSGHRPLDMIRARKKHIQ
jgi:hypothetical protein